MPSVRVRFGSLEGKMNLPVTHKFGSKVNWITEHLIAFLMIVCIASNIYNHNKSVTMNLIVSSSQCSVSDGIARPCDLSGNIRRLSRGELDIADWPTDVRGWTRSMFNKQF